MLTERWGILFISDPSFAPAQQKAVAFGMGLCHVHGVPGNHSCICSATSSEEQLTAVISAARGTRQVADQQDCPNHPREGPGCQPEVDLCCLPGRLGAASPICRPRGREEIQLTKLNYFVNEDK